MKLDTKSTNSRKIIDFRKAGFARMVALGKYNYTRAEKNLADHAHENMIEICYLNKGSQRFHVNKKPYLIKGGEVFINFPGELHGTGEYPEEKGLLYWMLIRTGNKKENHGKGKLDGLGCLCAELIKKNIRHFKGVNELPHLLEKIFAAFQKGKNLTMKRIQVSILVQTFLLKLLECIDKGNFNAPHERFEKVLRYIDQHITCAIPIAALADEMSLSESRFKSLFKELTGFTPGDYVQRKRVDLALERMKENPAISLTDLAYELNFSSPQYFSHVIKKYTGIPPHALKGSHSARKQS